MCSRVTKTVKAELRVYQAYVIAEVLIEGMDVQSAVTEATKLVKPHYPGVHCSISCTIADLAAYC